MQRVEVASAAAVASFAVTLALFSLFSAIARADDKQANIIGGELVLATDPVAQSTVLVQTTRLSGPDHCSGSLIAEDLVITAAHCVTDDEGKVVLPRQLKVLFKLDVAGLGIAADVIGALVPIDWAGEAASDDDRQDIALIRFRGRLPRGYRPATQLPATAPLIQGDLVTLAGYGITNAKTHLGEGKLRKVDGLRVANPLLGKTEAVVDQTQGRGACHGDSGGPAFIKQGGELLLWGVASRSYPDTAPNDCAHFAVYSQLSASSAWIDKSAIALRRRH